MPRYIITTSSPERERSHDSIQMEDRKTASQNTLIKEEEPDSQSSGRQQSIEKFGNKSFSPQDHKEKVSLVGSHDSNPKFETALDCYLSIDTSKSRR